VDENNSSVAHPMPRLDKHVFFMPLCSPATGTSGLAYVQFPFFLLYCVCFAVVVSCGLGPVMVSKMPALHPGDVRKLEAVAVSGLEHLYDVIVFPQKAE